MSNTHYMITRSKIKNDNKGNDDDSDDEEYSPSKRQKIIVDFITDIVNKNIDIEFETDDSEDEYDKEFEELENSNEIDSNDINLDYFKKLKLHQKN